MVLLPKKGYLMLFTGVIIGILITMIVASYYSTKTVITGKIKEVTITFLYSSEKEGWIEEVTPIFEKYIYDRYGLEVKVNLVPAGSHESINLILQGSIKPTVWSPASSIWIPYLNTLWEREHNTKIATEWYPLVFSPIVIATWKSFVKKYNITNFKDLYKLSKNGIKFKWGHTDPELSNSGAMIVLLEFCEAAGRTPDKLTIKDLENKTVQNFVREIEKHAVMYGKSTGFFGSWAVDSGPSSIDLFGVYENIIIDNAYKAYKKWGDSLVAIYPSFGTLFSDHPYVILNAPWVTAEQRLIASYYLYFLLQPDIQKLAEKHGFRPVNPEVQLNQEIFSEKNGVIPKLKVKILNPPSGEVLEALFKVWEKVKNPGV